MFRVADGAEKGAAASITSEPGELAVRAPYRNVIGAVRALWREDDPIIDLR